MTCVDHERYLEAEKDVDFLHFVVHPVVFRADLNTDVLTGDVTWAKYERAAAGVAVDALIHASYWDLDLQGWRPSVGAEG